MTKLHIKMEGGATKSNKNENQVPVNFYVTRLNDLNKKAHGYCMVF
jgi:hypothetical protein